MRAPPRVLLAVILPCLLLAPSGRADDPPPKRATPSSRWSAFEPGTWVITRNTYRGVSYHPDGVEYRRTMLLGTDPSGGLRYVDHKSDQPGGPWVQVFEHADGQEWYQVDNARVQDLGEQTLKVGDQSVRCRAYEIHITDDYGTTTARRWVDVASGVEIQIEKEFGPKPGKPDSVLRKTTLTTLRIAEKKFRDKTIPTVEQRWVEEAGGKPLRIYQWVRSTSIPGSHFLQAMWNGPDAETTKPPNGEIQVVDWGTSPELLAQYRREHPSMDDRRRHEDQERIARVQKLFRDTIAQAAADNEASRASAIRTLSAWGEPAELKGEVVAALEKAMADPSPLVRREATVGLAKCKVDGAAPRILKLMAGDPEGRPQYLAALAATADPAALDALVAATEDLKPHLRGIAARGLGNLKSDPSRLALERLLATDPDPNVRVAAVSSLKTMADKRSLPALLAKLADPSTTVRTNVIEAVVQIGDDSVLPPLSKLLADPDEKIRASTCIWLGQLKVQDRAKVGDAVLPLLNDASLSVRGAAVTACAGLKEARAVPALLELVNDPKNFQADSGLFVPIGELAMAALGRVGGKSAVAGLVRLAASEDQAIARGALAAAGLIDGPAPDAARSFWQLYLAAAPKTRDAERQRSQYLQLVAQLGDDSTAKEIEAHLESAAPIEKRALRETARAIRERKPPAK